MKVSHPIQHQTTTSTTYSHHLPGWTTKDCPCCVDRSSVHYEREEQRYPEESSRTWNNPERLEYLTGYHIVDEFDKTGMNSAPAIVPHENDILMGRGGKNNQWIGNEQLRSFARAQCELYSRSSKKDKSQISRQLVRQVRELDPPGRFLKRSSSTGRWEDVGDDIAREKASQALRDAVSHVSSGQTDEGEVRRAASAPTVLSDPSEFSSAPSSTSIRRRRSDAADDEESERTPFLPPVTPSSSTAGSASSKRRRYFRHASYSWSGSVERLHSHPYEGNGRRHPPLQQLRQPPQDQTMQHHQQQHSGYAVQQVRSAALPEGAEAEVVDFDLFHGELLESGDDASRPASPVADILPSGGF